MKTLLLMELTPDQWWWVKLLVALLIISAGIISTIKVIQQHDRQVERIEELSAKNAELADAGNDAIEIAKELSAENKKLYADNAKLVDVNTGTIKFGEELLAENIKLKQKVDKLSKPSSAPKSKRN